MPFHNNLNILNRYVYRIETIFQETINYKYVLNEYGLYDIVPLFTARSIHHTQTHSIIGNETANNLINNQLGGEGLQNLTALLQMEFIRQNLNEITRTASERTYPMGMGYIDPEHGIQLIVVESQEQYIATARYIMFRQLFTVS